MNRNYLVSDTRSLRCRGQHSCCNARAADKHKQMNPNTMFDTPAYIQREVVCLRECVCAFLPVCHNAPNLLLSLLTVS